MMAGRHEEIDLSRVRTLSIRERKSKVDAAQFAAAPRAGMTVADLVASLPDLLGGADFRTLLDRIERAVRERREWIVMIGGHVVKTGTAPCFTPRVRGRQITCVAMNGSAAVHDVEIALFGRTSEVVEEGLADGSFGMARETAEFLNGAAERARREDVGFGAALGAALAEASAPHSDRSLLAAAHESGIPATVHVALGTDIVHQHPSADGASIGAASLRDFRILAARVARLSGGVVLNLGSAVVLPEVFLKALTVARNLGGRIRDFTAADFDMIRQYRPLTNVVSRPTRDGGFGAHFTGQHEILLPLLAAALADRLGGPQGPAAGPAR
jgi:hypothetical protein